MTIHDNELTSLENAFKYLILERVERCEITVFENHRKSLNQHCMSILMYKNWWKLPKLKSSNDTFLVIFKQCEGADERCSNIS